ncbi:hypothetical protein ES707_11742 [subsurface metagenome]
MDGWIKLVNDFGPWVFILIIVALYTQGKILSKKTMDKIEKSHESNLAGMREAFEKTIKNICEEHTKEVKMITSSFNKQIAQLKEIIKIFKQRNNIK